MSKLSEPNPAARANSPSLEQTLKQKKFWIAVAGIVATLVSPLLTWLTVTLSLTNAAASFFTPTLTVVISGYDATWNVVYGPIGIRIIYVQLLSTAVAFLTLLLGVFQIISSKYSRGYLLVLGGIVGVVAPIEFAYALVAQGQTLSSQFQQLSPLVGALIQPNYGFTIGAGLVIATLGPLLLITSGVLVLLEKRRESKPINVGPLHTPSPTTVTN